MTHGFDAASDSVEPAARPVDVVDRVLATINQGVVILSSIALVIASIVLTYSVFSRYFFHFSTDWQDELSVFLIVGAVFMSAAAIQAQRGHVGDRGDRRPLSPRAQSHPPARRRPRELRVLRLLRLEVLDPARRSVD